MSCHYFDWDICFYLYKMVTRYAAIIIFGAPALREKFFFFDSLDLNRDQTTFIFLFERTNKPKRSTSELEKKVLCCIRKSDMRGGGKKTISLLLMIQSVYLFAVCLHFSGGSPVPRRHHNHLKFGLGRVKMREINQVDN